MNDDIRDLRIRALMGLWHPSSDELVKLIESVEDGLDDANFETISANEGKANAEEETKQANEEKYKTEEQLDKAEAKLEEYLQAEEGGSEAMAARIVSLTSDLSKAREETEKVRRELRRFKNQPKQRRRAKRSTASTPEVVLPTYEIQDDAPNVVRVAFGAKDPERARELYIEGGKFDENPKTYEKAEKLYREAIRLDPSLAVARTNLANIRYRRGETDEAIQHWQDAMRIDPQQPEAYYNLGFAYLTLDQAKRSIPLFRAALRLVSDSDELAPDIHYNLASALDEMGDVDTARIHWQKHVDLAPDGEWAEYARTFLRDTTPTPTPPPVRKSNLTAIQGGKSKGKP